MEVGFRLGKIWGIPIGLHFSWFLIFGLLTWSLASGYFPMEYPQLAPAAHWLMAAVTSLLFAGSVLAHELGHAALALRNRIGVRGITLFIFGGVAQIDREAPTPGAEFRIAIAGPLVSLALGVFFGGLWLLDRAVPFLAAPSEYLMRINLMLAVFNMIPGFPLDGGRVLRALIWKWTGSYTRATRLAVTSGQLVAFGFIGFGIFTLINGNFFNGLWLAFIGWFLQNAAASAAMQVNLEQTLRDVRVGQVMMRDCVQVPSLTPLSQLVNENVINGGQQCFFVSESGRPDGLLTLEEITSVPQGKWRFTTTRQAMTPFDRLVQVDPDTALLEALRTMEQADLQQLPVVQDDKLVGLLSRDRVLHYMRTRAELGV